LAKPSKICQLYERYTEIFYHEYGMYEIDSVLNPDDQANGFVLSNNAAALIGLTYITVARTLCLIRKQDDGFDT
jgi:hypothetical protein